MIAIPFLARMLLAALLIVLCPLYAEAQLFRPKDPCANGQCSTPTQQYQGMQPVQFVAPQRVVLPSAPATAAKSVPVGKKVDDGIEPFMTQGVVQAKVTGLTEFSSTQYATALAAEDNKLRLVITGEDDAARANAVRVLQGPEFADLRDKFVVYNGPRDKFKDRDGKLLYSPRPGESPAVMIFAQAPSGEVLHHQDGFEGPKDFQALRKLDPTKLDPARDPDVRRVLPDRWLPEFLTSISEFDLCAIVIAIGAVIYFWQTRKTK
jgi:hypothetical protein